MRVFLEHWRDIAGYEGLYQVSDFGDVRSLGRWVNGMNDSKRFVKCRVLKPQKDGGGYLIVSLYKDGKIKTHTVHRLVAEAFIPNPENLTEINHIDEDKTNNVVTNLEWCNRKYNINHGTRNKRVSASMTNGKLSKKPIQLTLDYIFVKEWESTAECHRNGFNSSHVSACCRGVYGKQCNVYKGFRWMYAEYFYKEAVA